MSRKAISLPSQLAWRFGAVAVFVSIGLASALGWMLASEVESRDLERLRTVSRSAAMALAADVARQARNVRSIAGSATLWRDGLDSPLVLEALHRVQAVSPEDSWIGVADAQGVVRAATGGLLVGADVHARPWFSPGLQGPTLGELHEAKLLATYLPGSPNGEPLRFLDFSAPVRVDGRTIGVLGIHGSWAWADEVVRRFAPTQASAASIETFIFDRRGRLIYAPGGRIAPFAGQRRPGPAGRDESSALRWADGRDYLTSAFAVPTVEDGFDPGWIVVTRLPADVAKVAARSVSEKALACGLLAALLAALLGRRLAFRITRPLHELSRAVGQLAPGDVLAEPLSTGSPEVQGLARAMHGMTAKLARSNQELEARVSSRTAELQAAMQELASMAHTDALTGLLNRRGLTERARVALASARRSGRPVSIALVDADHFKKINDTHGHDVGDLTLQAIAQAMGHRVRETDAVARWGGEEFLVLMPDTDAGGALIAARALVETVAALAVPHVGHVTVSCGVATLAATDTLELAAARADEALYRAKAGGRNRAEAGVQAHPEPAASTP